MKNQLLDEIFVLSIQGVKLSCWSSIQSEDAIFLANQIARPFRLFID